MLRSRGAREHRVRRAHAREAAVGDRTSAVERARGAAVTGAGVRAVGEGSCARVRGVHAVDQGGGAAAWLVAAGVRGQDAGAGVGVDGAGEGEGDGGEGDGEGVAEHYYGGEVCAAED